MCEASSSVDTLRIRAFVCLKIEAARALQDDQAGRLLECQVLVSDANLASLGAKLRVMDAN